MGKDLRSAFYQVRDMELCRVQVTSRLTNGAGCGSGPIGGRARPQRNFAGELGEAVDVPALLTTTKVSIKLDAGLCSAEEIRQVEALIRRVRRIIRQAKPQQRDVDSVR
jgi:hypothetical protein